MCRNGLTVKTLYIDCKHSLLRHSVCLKHSFTHVFLSAADQVKCEAGLVFPVYLDSDTTMRRVRLTHTV